MVADRAGGGGGGESTGLRADLLAGFEEALEGPRAGYMHVAAHHLVRVGHSGRHHLGKCADAHLCPSATPRHALGALLSCSTSSCTLYCLSADARLGWAADACTLAGSGPSLEPSTAPSDTCSCNNRELLSRRHTCIIFHACTTLATMDIAKPSFCHILLAGAGGGPKCNISGKYGSLQTAKGN